MAVTIGTPYSGASASPAYSGAAAGGVFVPEIWSGKLIEKFYSATVLAAIANTDYEGEISNKGDKVKIRTKPTITIRDYTIDQSLVVERPSSSTVELTIDYAKYFNEVLDDVMELQSDMNLLSMWADDASEQLKIVIDTGVLGLIDAGIDANNKGITAGRLTDMNLGTTAAPVTLTALNVLDSIVDMGTVLDEQNIPETGRWLVVPAWCAGLIKKSDLRNASISGDGVSLMRNGRLGMIDRFTLYASNLLPTAVEGATTATRIFAGHPHGLTFASQISKVETLRSESTFGTLLRGLQVYGAKVLDGTAITELYAIKGSPYRREFTVATIGRLLSDARAILNDRVETSGSLRFSDEDLIQAFNMALLQTRTKRPDAFLAMGLRNGLPAFKMPDDADTPFPLDDMFYTPFMFYVVGHSELREDTFTDDGRATALLNKFTTGILQVLS